jgi:hypothetical protein|tara:strand:+ start:468 stop:662 length:195 start_codon:yes stop_codon:yes gene_type:complete
MNWFWGFWFKDKYRTPFSVYKMSFAELLILGSMIFGIGCGATLGIKSLIPQVEKSVTAESAIKG